VLPPRGMRRRYRKPPTFLNLEVLDDRE
jgi:hypothetical protein